MVCNTSILHAIFSFFHRMDEIILKLYVDEQNTLQVISSKLNIKISKIVKILRKYNYFASKNKKNTEVIAIKNAIDYFKENNTLPIKEVGNMFGVKERVLATFLRKSGNNNRNFNYRSVIRNARKYNIEIGDIYGVYTVIDKTLVDNPKCKETRYICENIYNSSIKCMRASALIKQDKRVKEKSKSDRQRGLRNYLYRSYQIGAKNRNHKFNLSFDDFDKIISQNCYYCGEEPKIADSDFIIKRGDTHQYPIKYNGIDRLNPKLGYSIENCVPCCQKCNYMKHIMTEEEFYKQIIKVYNNKKLANYKTSEIS